MINFTIKYKGETIKGQTPGSWEEVTTKQFLALELSGYDISNPIITFGLLADIDVKTLLNTKTNLGRELHDSLQWLVTTPPDWKKLDHKKKIRFMGKDIKVPHNLDLEMFGQKVMLAGAMKKAEENMMQAIPEAIAIYFQPIVDGEMKIERLPYIQEEVKKLPILESYPITTFFFRRFTDYLNTGLAY